MIKRLVVGQFQANCYIMVDEATASAALIDPGDEALVISRVIKESGAKLTHIMMTHIHPDHVLAAGKLQEEYPDATVMVHQDDMPFLLEDMIELAAFSFDLSDCRPFHPTIYFEDGQQLKVGEMEIKVIHTPGHTPGGVCLSVDKVLFTGDTLFASGIGRTDLSGGSYEQIMHSIREKLLVLPEETTIYPGHGPESTIGEEKRSNPWLVG